MFFSKKFVSKSLHYNDMQDGLVTKKVPAPLMRKTFEIEKKAKRYNLTVCGLGFYKVFVNGKEITKGEISSYYYNPNDFLYYDNYDVTKLIKKGKNVFGFILGNGLLNSLDGNIWNFLNAKWRSAPKLAFSLTDGEKVLFEADKVKCQDSPILFDDLRSGAEYDATKEIKGWNLAEFDDSSWSKAIAAETPKGEPKLLNIEPVKIEREIKPVSITKTDDGYIYDFGEVNAGVCRLNIKGEKGQKVILKHAEFLRDGKLCFENITLWERLPMNTVHTDVYTCGGERESFVPPFTFHGFRYVLVSGITEEQATKSLLTYLVMHADLKKAGEFTCSDQMINKIQDATIKSNLANLVFVPTDCPQREKNGWTGDAALSAEQFLYNHKAEKLLHEWLNQLVESQDTLGRFSGIVPTANWNYGSYNGPAWDIALIEVAYRIYITTGDKNVLNGISGAVSKYIKYLQTRINEKGLLAFGLGDWCEAGAKYENQPKTPIEVTDTITVIRYLDLSAKIFKILNKGGDAERFIKLKNELIKTFRKEYVKDCLITCNTISAQAMGIFYGIFNKDELDRAYKNLTDLINADEYGFRVGVLGGRVLFEVLSEFGDAELCYKLITKKEFPSYAYLINHGATTLWEGFTELKEGEMTRVDGERLLSLNHHFFGFVSTFFYKYLAGIKLVDYKTAVVSPVIVEEVKTVCATHEFIGGKLTVKIEQKDTRVYISVVVKGDIEVSFNCPKGYKTIDSIKIKKGNNKIILERE